MTRQPPDDATYRLADLCSQFLRRPTEIALDDVTGPVLIFDPPLTPAEEVELASIVRMARSAVVITPEERDAIEDDLAALRAFRQQSQAEFMAKTANARDRELFDAVNAQTNVLRAFLRD